MIKNYLKITFRNLMKQKLHSLINIAGLTIGMAVSILILSYVWFERSFDRFHSKSDQIYRVVEFTRQAGKEINGGGSGHGLAEVLKEEFPEIIHSVRLFIAHDEAELSYKGIKTMTRQTDMDMIFSDNDIFKVFDIDLIYGDSETALLEPNSIVLTEEASKKFFGNENPIGEFIHFHFPSGYLEDWDLKVTGVARAMPDNSHFAFNYIIPLAKEFRISRLWPFVVPLLNTYLILPEGYPSENLEEKFPEIVKKYISPEIEKKYSTTYDEFLESGGYWKLKLQALTKIHLDKHSLQEIPGAKEKGNLLHVQIYTVIALIIILLACINFITLSTARSGTRAKEVGLRKVNGAARQQLIWQFLTESILLSMIALVLALIMVAAFSRPFNSLLEIQTAHNVTGIMFILASLFLVTLIVGVIAGSYPAFFLSAFRPVEVLKGKLLEKRKGLGIRNSLVVFQFLISMLLIISSVTIYKQFVYMLNKDLGFDKENVIIINHLIGAYYDDPHMSHDEREIQFATLRQDILEHPSVVGASLAGSIPGLNDRHFNIDVRPEGADEGTTYGIPYSNIDYAYYDVFGLEMVAGRNFREESGIPQTQEGIIINEKAVEFLGLEDPLEKYIETVNDVRIKTSEGKYRWVKEKVQIPIIGVFKDFHTRDLHQENIATLYVPQYYEHYFGFFMAVRFLPGNIPENIAFLEKTWNKMGVSTPFNYSFLDKALEAQYNKEKKLVQVFTFFAILAIIIACLGIYGLAAFSAAQRTKEIGIRKVMGASVGVVVKILSRLYVKLLVIASLLACPVGYILMNKWLQGFSFRTNIGTGIFVLTILITTVIVLASVSYHSIKAALTNPADTLKYE